MYVEKLFNDKGLGLNFDGVFRSQNTIFKYFFKKYSKHVVKYQINIRYNIHKIFS